MNLPENKVLKLGIIGPEKGPGQLGMFLALAANKIFCAGECSILINTIGSESAPEWSDAHFGLSADEVQAFYKQTDSITFETESISESFRDKFHNKLMPSIDALKIFRNRFSEKNYFKELGLKTPEFYLLDTKADLEKILKKLTSKENFVGRLKTVENGYDGHGQSKVNEVETLQAAWKELNEATCILEAEILIHRELSIISTRFADGRIIHFPIPQNEHRNSILYRSRTAKISAKVESKLKEMNEKVLSKLNYIGTFTLETFQITGPSGSLLINEGAPRVHNSGHYTLDACANVNQFDAHIRALADLPCPEPELKLPFFSMTNLLGLSESHYTAIKAQLEESSLVQDGTVIANFYWYNKLQPKPGRKMGHITITAESLKKLEAAETLIDKLILQLEV